MPAEADKQAALPVLSGCYNVVSNARTVMAGSVMQLEGENLTFDKHDVQQGLFLVDFAGEAFKITGIVRMRADNIIFMIPGGIPGGVYKLEFRRRYTYKESLETSTLPSAIRLII